MLATVFLRSRIPRCDLEHDGYSNTQTMTTAITTIKAFVAGVLAILVFHQGALAGLHYLGETPVLAYAMTPGWLLGWPILVLWALWGGGWGIVLWALIRGTQAAGYYVGAIILAAVLPSAAYLFVLPPLRGLPLAYGWDQHFMAGVVLLQAIWGLGLALFMRVFRPPR